MAHLQDSPDLVAFAARLASFVPWLESQRDRLHEPGGQGLRLAMATTAELTHHIHHAYEPVLRSTHSVARTTARQQLAERLAEQLDRWPEHTPVERPVLADFWRLISSLIWATTGHHRDLREHAGMRPEVGAETRKQHRFSTQNAHEAWALVLEGFYEPGAAEEAAGWLLLHVRDCVRRDYRTALLAQGRMDDPAVSAGPPTLGSLESGWDLTLGDSIPGLTVGADPDGDPTVG